MPLHRLASYLTTKKVLWERLAYLPLAMAALALMTLFLLVPTLMSGQSTNESYQRTTAPEMDIAGVAKETTEIGLRDFGFRADDSREGPPFHPESEPISDSELDASNRSDLEPPLTVPDFRTALRASDWPEPGAGPLEQACCDESHEPLKRLARSLKERKIKLEEREEELEVKTRALMVIRDKLALDIERLEHARLELEKLVGKIDEQERERLEQLVKVYETMKPKKAAEIFDRLELSVILRVATRMREAKLADILASMNPDKARIVTSQLARDIDPRSLSIGN